LGARAKAFYIFSRGDGMNLLTAGTGLQFAAKSMTIQATWQAATNDEPLKINESEGTLLGQKFCD
jgi:hypothetical protein